MKVEIIQCLKDNYSYLIIDEKNKTACVIDPSEAKPIIDYLNKHHIQLNYILNTHHHYDHVGGNKELKNKYNAKIIGYVGDTKRIPFIDIALEDQSIWIENDFEARVIHVPGHTLGHICFYFYKDENLFTGDTLFSLGCGKIFEGTYEQMFSSINKIKKLPPNTKIYCGHEYTKKNSDFCISLDSKNNKLISKIKEINSKISNKLPTIPSTLKDETECNIFLRCEDISIKSSLNMNNSEPREIFAKLRDLKDNF